MHVFFCYNTIYLLLYLLYDPTSATPSHMYFHVPRTLSHWTLGFTLTMHYHGYTDILHVSLSSCCWKRLCCITKSVSDMLKESSGGRGREDEMNSIFPGRTFFEHVQGYSSLDFVWGHAHNALWHDLASWSWDRAALDKYKLLLWYVDYGMRGC